MEVALLLLAVAGIVYAIWAWHIVKDEIRYRRAVRRRIRELGEGRWGEP